MQLDPKTAMIIKIVLSLLTAISTGTLSLTGLVSPQTATLIIAIAGSGVAVLGIVMSAYSSSAPGPLAPPDAPVIVAATKVANLAPNATLSQITMAKGEATAAVNAHQP